jgi:hypothetical protein
MDISQLRNRLASLQNPKASGRGELKKTLWSPTVGKHSVRIVPSLFDKANPFKELYFHYEFGKTMISLTNFGEKDPIVEFAQGLRKSSNKEDWQLAKKLEPKLRIFAPVIVRGEEDKGVLLWGFGKQIYMDLLSIAEDEDVGDYTDPVQGRDITIETLDKASTGLTYDKSTVRIRTKVTPLSTKADEAKKWLSEQPDPMTQFKRYSYDEMKAALLTYLNPESEAEQAASAPTPTEEPKQQKFSLSTSKEDTNSKIDDLFSF